MYGPGEILFLEDSHNNPSLYYVLKGKIEMFTKRDDIKHVVGSLGVSKQVAAHSSPSNTYLSSTP